MTTRKWSCNCGSFEGQVTGDPALACWCHCLMCRKQTGAAMQLGVFENFEVLKGDDNLIVYSGAPNVYRKTCKTCGSFCYKILANGAKVAPLGALDPSAKATCHIMVKHKGDSDICFPELPRYEEMP